MFPPGPPFPPPQGLDLRQGPCLRYAVPAGWSVVEDGQFAVVLVAPDQRAVTTVVGNVGLPNGFPPGQYLWDRLCQAGYQALRLGPLQPAPPALGFPAAWECDVDYLVQGIACHGLARCSVAPSYGFCTMVMTFAASEAAQWPRYAPWLPQAAAQVQIVHPAAFGAAGIAQQNLHDARVIGEQARLAREHSAQQWAQATQERAASQDRIHAGFRDALGGGQAYHDPYRNELVELPAANGAYWVHRITGQIVGHPDPTFDPRTPTDADWLPMNRSR